MEQRSERNLVLSVGARVERFIRLLKENLLWVRTFRTVEELRQVLQELRNLYNTQWSIERHGNKAPGVE